MARDYKEERLRSGDKVTIKTDRISEEGAYVCVPVEALDKVKLLIEEQKKYVLEWNEVTYKEQLGVLEDIENELFPEESSK